MNAKKQTPQNFVLIAIYSLVFFYLVFQGAIFSPDTYTYLHAMPFRSAGYVIFIKFFEFVSPSYFGQIIVVVQLLLGLASVHLFFKTISNLLQLSIAIKVLALLLLLFPFFPPLYVANNVCSEGLSYPLYLLFLSFGLEFLYSEKKYTLFWMFVTYSILILVRGQFIVVSLIFAFVYLFKNRNSILQKRNLMKLTFILVFPLITNFADKTYHKLKDGTFSSTPFTFVAMSGAAFYVSKEADVDFIENEDHKIIFQKCYQQLEAKKLLLTSQHRSGYDAHYKHFHDNVGMIANATIHDISRAYYYDRYLETSNDTKSASAWSSWQSELACKNFFFTLVKHNFKEWSLLYLSNLLHGFKSVFMLFFVVAVFLFSGFKVIFKNKQDFEILFIFSALTLSNALIVSIACHSIMRYLFYNYILIFLMAIILIKLTLNAQRN